MVSLVFIQGSTSVRLGLDLRGGTSVTLQPRIAPGDEGKVTSEAIDQAVSIIRQRVNSLGVAESEVTAQGSGTNRQIVISVPGDTGRRVVDLVGQTAELRFRQVLASASGVPAAADAAATPAAGVSAAVNAKFAALDCTKPENLQGTGADAPTDTLVACDRSGGAKYILAPAEVLGRQIRLPRSCGGFVRTSFASLCGQALGAQDYLALAARFHTVFLEEIPCLEISRRNEAKRFVTLIDALYEAGTKLIALADADPDDLYPAGDGAFEFERTASRLHEMRSEAYLDRVKD
jgi:hypothetical protein